MLIFIDESGHPHPTDESPFSVLAAIAMREEKSRDFSRELFNLKRLFKGISDPYEWEIKGRELLAGRLITPRKREFIQEIFALCRTYGIVTFATVMERPREGALTPEINPYLHDLYKFLMRRVDCYVRESEPDQRAIFLFDAMDDKSNERLAKRFTAYLYKTRAGKDYQNILDTPFFVNSKMTPGIQIADLFAYIINKRFQRKGLPYFEEYYKEIKAMQFEWENEETTVVVRGIKFITPVEKESDENPCES